MAYKPRTEEQKKRHREYERARYNALSEEEKDVLRRKNMERYHARKVLRPYKEKIKVNKTPRRVARTREEKLEVAAAWRAERRKWFDDYKSSRCCITCGETNPDTFDFHHLGGLEKENRISQMLGGPMTTLENELAKCVVLCRNCHALFHHEHREPIPVPTVGTRAYRRYNQKIKVKHFLIEYKELRGCFVCGNKNPIVLEFHHRDRADKSFSIARAYSSGGSIATISQELLKCEVVCSCCHVKIHADERRAAKEAALS